MFLFFKGLEFDHLCVWCSSATTVHLWVSLAVKHGPTRSEAGCSSSSSSSNTLGGADSH